MSENKDNSNNQINNDLENLTNKEEDNEEVNENMENNIENDEEDGGEEENESEEIPEENFSQQVDFLFHPEFPEYITQRKFKLNPFEIPLNDNTNNINNINNINNNNINNINNINNNNNNLSNNININEKLLNDYITDMKLGKIDIPFTKPQPIVKQNKKKLNKKNTKIKKPNFNFKKPKNKPIHKKMTKNQIAKENLLKEQNFNTDIKCNEKGLFDPALKINELQYESRINKQKMERLKKIEEYDERFSRQKAMYDNKNGLMNNYKQNLINEQRNFITPKNKNIEGNKELESLLNKLKSVPKPNLTKQEMKELDFNPMKYENIISSLLYQISETKNEREKANNLFMNKIKQIQNDFIQFKANEIAYNTTNNKKKQRARSKSAKKFRTIKSTIGYFNNKRRPKSRVGTARNNKIRRALDKDFKNKSKHNVSNYTKSDSKSKNKFYNNTNYTSPNNKIQLIQVVNNNKITRENEIPVYNLSESNIIIKESTNKKPEINTINSYLVQSNNNEYIQNINFSDNKQNDINYNDKMEILNKLNEQINEYSKGLPKLVDKVNKTLDKITIDEEKKINQNLHKNPFISMASKSAYQIIQNNNDVIINKIIDDLLIENVFELQDIENKTNSQKEKKYLLQNMSECIENIINIENREKEILNKTQISSFGCTNMNKDNTNNFVTDKGDKNIQNKNNEDDNKICKLPVTKYKANLNNKNIESIEDYKKKFYEYMLLKGSFYFPNIFELYDKFVNSFANEILADELSYCTKQVDDFVVKLYKEEVLGLNN